MLMLDLQHQKAMLELIKKIYDLSIDSTHHNQSLIFENEINHISNLNHIKNYIIFNKPINVNNLIPSSLKQETQ